MIEFCAADVVVEVTALVDVTEVDWRVALVMRFNLLVDNCLIARIESDVSV